MMNNGGWMGFGAGGGMWIWTLIAALVVIGCPDQKGLRKINPVLTVTAGQGSAIWRPHPVT
jgi:hypothetical protein